MTPPPSHNPHHAGASPRVLVTGGAGFIGSHLVDALLDGFPDADITVVDDLSTGRLSNLDRALERVDGCRARLAVMQRTVQEALPELAEGEPFDRIFHLAAAVGVQRVVDDPIGCIETNVDATAALLRFAVGIGGPPILIASSSEVYGKSPGSPFQEEDDCVYGPTTAPRWSYGASKAIDEYLALAHHQHHGLPAVVVRLFNTVGPRQVGDYGMVLPRFVRAALAGEPITVFGDGSQTRCFCDVRDVVPTMIRLLEAAASPGGAIAGRVFNLGSDSPISIAELAESVRSEVGSESRIRFVPFDEAMGPGFEDLAQRRPCLKRLRTAIDFEPKIPLRRTVQDIADALRLSHSTGEAGAR
jgi:UDP-glucose 4-epimerase